METYIEVGKKIKLMKEILAEYIVKKQIEMYPYLQKYDDHQKKMFFEDTCYHLNFLAESVYFNEPVLFEEYAKWCKTFFNAIKIPDKDIISNYELMLFAIKSLISANYIKIVEEFINNAIKIYNTTNPEIESYINNSNPYKEFANSYLSFLLNGNKKEAIDLIISKFKEGLPILDIYRFIFEVTQKEVGRLWQMGQVLVTQEHFITAVTQSIMAQLYPYIFTNLNKKNRIFVSCITGELHEMGPRMIADIFELYNWDSYYFGANTPSFSIINSLDIYNPKILAISATLSINISSVQQLIYQVKSINKYKNIKIIVGGYPFNTVKDLWKKVGADYCAYDFNSAIKFANNYFD